MAIIYSYPTVDPVREDLILGTDVSSSNKATKNFTIQSVIDLVTVATGDLQTVLDLGFTAVGKDIDLTNNAFRGGSFRSVGGIVISGTTGIGFTNLTSTAFTGTIATAAQPNITSLGALTALVLNGPISGTNLITSSNLAGAQNDNVVSTLAIKTYVDNQVGLFDTLAEVLANGNTTGGTSIVVSAADNITFTDTSKALFGNSQDLEVNHDGFDSFITDLSTGDLRLRSDDAVKIQASTGGNNLATFTKGAGVDLYHNNVKKIETLATGAKVTGAFEATTTGTFAGIINTLSYTDSSGDTGSAGQILSSTGGGTNWVTEVPLYNWQFESTTVPSGTDITITDGNNITTTWDAGTYNLTIAASGDGVTGTGLANQITYWTGAQTVAGGAGFTYAGGATGQVTVAGILQAGTLSDGTFSGSAGTYTGGVSIESATFVGALTGNADTATALASSGAISLTGDTESTGGPHTYTLGGAVTIPTTIANTTVTAKTLFNLATPTSAAISAGDTILAAMAKLQGQIDGIAGSLAFEGTWDASTGNPPSATPLNGQFWIVSVAGNTNLDGITDWLVGDWAIYVNNGAGTDAWQKLDQSNEVLGSGTAQKMAMWSGTVGDASQTLATGLIEQNAANNLITIGNSGSLLVEGNTTLGNADADTTTVKGPATFEFATRFNEGISLGTATYGTAGQVLTSGGGSASVNTWTTPTTGTVTSVGLTETGDALTITGSPVTSSGTINIAGAGASTQYINGELNLVTFPTVDNYVSWTADSDEGTDITVTSGFNLKFTGAVTAGGAGIATDSAVSANEMTIGLINAGGTPGATTFYRGDGQWSVPVGTKTETLEEVLDNGNTTSGSNILVSEGDDLDIARGATNNSKLTFGTNIMQIWAEAGTGSPSPSYIKQSSGYPLNILTNELNIKDMANSETYVSATVNGSVDLYYDNSKKFETTSTGVSVTGGLNASSTSRFLGNSSAPLEWGDTSAVGFLSFDGSNNAIVRSASSKNLILQTNGANTALTIESNGNATFEAGLNVKANLAVQGGIQQDDEYVSSIGIFRSGRFCKQFTTSATVGTGTTAFVIERLGTTGNVLCFDATFCGGTNSTTSIAKKFTVIKTYGLAASSGGKIIFNKILDSGPGTGNSNTNDFNVEFLPFDSTTTSKMLCKITPVGVGSQTISITLDVAYDATVAQLFMNAS